MPAADTSYAEVTDLRFGDLVLPNYMGDGSKYVDGAAEEIDAAIGHMYVTPIELDESVPANRPAILLLKKVNWLLASGRLVLDLAAAGENSDLHAYGRQMLNEGLAYLQQMSSGEIVLTGAEPLPPRDSEQNLGGGPLILNEDAASLVEGFYARHRPVLPINPYALPSVQPYSGKP